MAIWRNRRFEITIKLLLGLFAAFVANAIATASAAAATPVIVSDRDRLVIVTDRGRLTGIQTPTTNEYLGIPYAAPPVGPLRWRPPRPHGRWHGVLQATQFSSYCTQPGFGSENCLYLNVYTPIDEKHPHRHRLPVMVWIPGGGLVTGGGGFY